MKIKFDKEQITVKSDIIGLLKFMFGCLVLIVALIKCDTFTVFILCMTVGMGLLLKKFFEVV